MFSANSGQLTTMSDNNENLENNIIENTDADNTKKSKKEKKEFNLGRELFEWFYTIIIALAIAVLIKGFIFDIVKVDGESMFPTLKNADRLIVTKLGYTPKHGDIIILDATYKKRAEYYENLAESEDKEVNWWFKLTNYFTLPENLKTKYYVKRVIAKEGQTVDIIDGKVYVDGELLDEPYYSGNTPIIDPSVEYPVTVEDNHVFVMGDNRPRSLDSRDSSLGAVPEEAVIGASKIRFWPLSEICLTK